MLGRDGEGRGHLPSGWHCQNAAFCWWHTIHQTAPCTCSTAPVEPCASGRVWQPLQAGTSASRPGPVSLDESCPTRCHSAWRWPARAGRGACHWACLCCLSLLAVQPPRVRLAQRRCGSSGMPRVLPQQAGWSALDGRGDVQATGPRLRTPWRALPTQCMQANVIQGGLTHGSNSGGGVAGATQRREKSGCGCLCTLIRSGVKRVEAGCSGSGVADARCP